MTTDFRALCVQLTNCLEKADWPHKQKHVFEQWLYIARKALAEPESIEDRIAKAAAAIKDGATSMSDPYVICVSLEWKLGIHLAEWNAARELAYRMGKAGDDLSQAHLNGVLQLLRDHLAKLEATS